MPCTWTRDTDAVQASERQASLAHTSALVNLRPLRGCSGTVSATD